MLIQKTIIQMKLLSPVIQELGVVDMGHYQTLIDFIQWGKYEFSPAEHYFINVWDHGTGWHDLPPCFRCKIKSPRKYQPR